MTAPDTCRTHKPSTGVSADDISNVAVFRARYLHLAKTPLFADSPLSLAERAHFEAALAGLSHRQHEQLAGELNAVVDRAAHELVEEPDFIRAVDRMPFDVGDRIVAVGDSITDDTCSWARILRRTFALLDRQIDIVNAGVSGNTTTAAIERLHLIEAARPTWVIQLLGTNDVRRHGKTQVRTLSLDESLRNLHSLSAAIQAAVGARVVRVAPPPLLEDRVAKWPRFHSEGITWRSADLAELARAQIEFDPRTTDLHTAMTGPLLEDWLLPDGVHPTVLGQQQITRILMAVIAA